MPVCRADVPDDGPERAEVPVLVEADQRATCGHPASGSVEVLAGRAGVSLVPKHGEEEAYRIERVAAIDHTSEAAEVRLAIDRLAARAAKLPDGPAAEALLAQMLAHQQTLAEIAARPVRRGGFQVVPLGETWAERWAEATVEGRRAILAEWGVTVVVRKSVDTRDVARLEISAVGLLDAEAREAIVAELGADDCP